MATSEGFGELTGRIGNHIYYKVGSQLRIRKMPTKDFSKKSNRESYLRISGSSEPCWQNHPALAS